MKYSTIIILLIFTLICKNQASEIAIKLEEPLPYPQHLIKMLNLTYTHNPRNFNNDFSVKLAYEGYGMTREGCISNRADLKQRMSTIFYNLIHEQSKRIPHLTHRIWITNQHNPHEAPQESLDFYLKSLKVFKAEGWKHYFWCLKKTDIPETIKTLQAAETPIEVHELSEISSSLKGKSIFDAYLANNQFCLASDVARQNIVYLYGGIYSDLGTLFLYDLTPFVNAYDYIFWFNGITLDQSFFGYKKNDPICKRFLNTLENIHRLRIDLKFLTPTPTKQMVWTSAAHFMTLFDVFSTSEDRFLLIPEGDHSLFTINHNRSWLNGGRFGNIPTLQSKLNIFSSQLEIPLPILIYDRKPERNERTYGLQAIGDLA